jgi:hypothetical protein
MKIVVLIVNTLKRLFVEKSLQGLDEEISDWFGGFVDKAWKVCMESLTYIDHIGVPLNLKFGVSLYNKYNQIDSLNMILV